MTDRSGLGSQPAARSWIWNGLVEPGKLTLVEGDPGVGKGFFVTDVIARFTSNRTMPDDTVSVCRPGRVIVHHPDDGAGHAMGRYAAAGADLARIVCINPPEVDGYTDQFSLPGEDQDAIIETIKQANAAVLVIDPVAAALATGARVYHAIASLRKIAAASGAAVITTHWRNKRSSKGTPAAHASADVVIRIREAPKIGMAEPRIMEPLKTTGNGPGRMSFTIGDPVKAHARVTWLKRK